MHSLSGEVVYSVVGPDGEEIGSFPTIRAAKVCKAEHGGDCRVVPVVT